VTLEASNDPLTGCHGYLVIADDGWLGTVETPLFGSDSSEPDYIAVSTSANGLAGRTLVPAARVREVDADGDLLFVQGKVYELTLLPSSLPLEPGRTQTREPAHSPGSL
jgi:hypothetical protein